MTMHHTQFQIIHVFLIFIHNIWSLNSNKTPLYKIFKVVSSCDDGRPHSIIDKFILNCSMDQCLLDGACGWSQEYTWDKECLDGQVSTCINIVYGTTLIWGNLGYTLYKAVFVLLFYWNSTYYWCQEVRETTSCYFHPILSVPS